MASAIAPPAHPGLAVTTERDDNLLGSGLPFRQLCRDFFSGYKGRLAARPGLLGSRPFRQVGSSVACDVSPMRPEQAN
jgi:hypothetical protein